MIGLVVTDLDDTLLDAHSALSQRAIAALRRAMDAGARVTLASGRMLESALPLARRIGVNGAMILYNGAMIYDSVAEKVLWSRRIPFETALSIVRLMEQMGFYIQLYPGEGYYCTEMMPCTEVYARSIQVAPTPVHMPMAQWLEAHPADLLKMLVIDTAQGADRAQAALAEAFPEGAGYLKSKPHYVEIVPPGLDKGVALAWVAEAYHLSPDQIMAFGDGQNDVSMLQRAGMSYAMQNGCEQARACASAIAPPNTRDGVARVLEDALNRRLIGRRPTP